MRLGATMLCGLCLLAGATAALSQENPGEPWTGWSRLLFSSLEIEKSGAFLSTGSKHSVQNATEDVSFFISQSEGFSLADADRARRLGWSSGRIELQSRAMIGVDRSFSSVFVSIAVGYSEARLKSDRPPDPNRRLALLAAAYEIAPANIPALLAVAPPTYWRSLQPPRMQSFKGGVVDVSLWWRPRPSLYAQLALVGDTAGQSLWTRLRLGYRLDPLPFALGPEFTAATGRNWEKFKLGLHLGDLTLWRFGLDLSGGWMRDETRRAGTYGSFAFYMKF